MEPLPARVEGLKGSIALGGKLEGTRDKPRTPVGLSEKNRLEKPLPLDMPRVIFNCKRICQVQKIRFIVEAWGLRVMLG